MGGGADLGQTLGGLIDQVVNLSGIAWGFILITLAAVFVFIWVMGAPNDTRRP